MSEIRVLVADDFPLFRDGVRVLLESVGDAVVVGEAATGEEAVVRTHELQPDLVLMDIKMPGINGIEATRRIVGANPDVRVLMFTMFEDDDSVFAAMRAGAHGYLLKGAHQEETLRAIRAVANGEAIFSPAIAKRVMQFFRVAPVAAPSALFPELTDREFEILELLAQRYTNPQIADRLVLSPKTVRNHVSNILHKLRVADRAEAMLTARAAGLGENGKPAQK
ncbi:MAG: response regulator transcription factor [Anaerolineales bacterium]|nr:response regulator transcription factor [Anaerolineales bacterium]